MGSFLLLSRNVKWVPVFFSQKLSVLWVYVTMRSNQQLVKKPSPFV